MKIKSSKIFLLFLILLGLINPLSQSVNQALAREIQIVDESSHQLLLEESLMKFPTPGRREGTGTYFEIKDSEYLDISLESTEEIKVVLASIPRMISLDIEALTDSINSTKLTIGGLEPNKTYYKYQDSYRNEAVFILDENGNYSWEQDLTDRKSVV